MIAVSDEAKLCKKHCKKLENGLGQ